MAKRQKSIQKYLLITVLLLDTSEVFVAASVMTGALMSDDGVMLAVLEVMALPGLLVAGS